MDMELARRAALLAAIVLAVGTAKYARLAPLIAVEPLDMAEEQRGETAWTEEGRRLRGLPFDDYVAESTRGILFRVDAPIWASFLDGVQAVSRAPEAEARRHPWAFRVSPGDWDLTYYPRIIFFRPDEPPLKDLSGQLRNNLDRAVLALERPGGEIRYYEVLYHAYSDEDFQFGSGFSRLPRPPSAIFNPYRKYSLWILLAGVILYVALPRPKRERGSIRYAGWRVALGDVASLLLFVPFFSLPIFIVGGTVQAFTRGWIFLLILWPFALTGAWMLQEMARLAGYEIRLRDDGLEIRVRGKARTVRFRELAFFRPLVLRPPRWLIVLTWLSALAGKGGARSGAAGRGILLGGAAYGGLGLFYKDGSSVNLWITDQMGSTALKNARRITESLDRAGVRREETPLEIRAVLPPEGAGPGGARLVKAGNILLYIFLVFPLAAIALLILFL